MKRPICNRCKGPLDLFYEPETDQQEWCCNNPDPLFTDGQFWAFWEELDPNEQQRLTDDGNSPR